MRRETIVTRTAGAIAALALCSVYGCAGSPITATRIENAIAPTFANLVQVQVSWLGLPPMSAAEFGVTAKCRRLVAGRDTGSGEWSCMLTWQGPKRQPLRDAYDLFVGTDGCYMAQVSGESLGGPVLKASDGRPVRNLLYAFDGCFDTM